MKQKRPTFRYGMKVSVTDKESFLYGLQGILRGADLENYWFLIELKDKTEHWTHGDSITPVPKITKRKNVAEKEATIIRIPVVYRRKSRRAKSSK